MCLAIPAQVSELLDDKQQFAIVDVMGVRRRANIELLSDDPPNLGDWVLIHVGFAMSKISAAYAECASAIEPSSATGTPFASR